jgi:hypothetical protein
MPTGLLINYEAYFRLQPDGLIAKGGIAYLQIWNERRCLSTR